MKKLFSESWKTLKESFLGRCIFFVVVGVILFLIFLLWEFPDYLYSIPIALFSVVGYSIIEAGEFQKFLKNTMLGVIQDSGYLVGLNRKKLDNMIDKLYQVYYELPEKMPADNLYQFVKNNILDRYIGKAYVERTNITWEFHNKPQEDCYEMTVTTDFELRTMSDKEISDTLEVGLVVTEIPGKPIEDHFPLDEWYIKTTEIREGSEHKKEELDKSKFQIEGKKCSYYIPYTVTRNQSLRIEVKKTGYEEAKEKIAHQLFVLPTHGFILRIVVHDFGDVTFSPKFSGIPPSEPKKSEPVSGTQFVMEYDGWMIPGNSVTITF